MIVYLANDLVWATRIKAAARALNVEARPARDVETLRLRLADSPVRGLIADLESDVALEAIGIARAAAPSIRIVAFGPHVLSERLDAARRAGADEALARGAFDRRLDDIIGSLA